MKRFKGGSLEIKADIKHGHIQSIRFIGDYLGLMDVNVIEKRLMNIRFNKADVDHMLRDYDLRTYFGEITKEEIMSLMFD
jgi:lipoate-protein ligase A